MARLLSKLSITVTIGMLLLFGAFFVSFADAQSSEVQVSGDAIPIRTEVVIPGSQVEATAEGAVKTVVSGLAGYIEDIYNFLISIVTLVAGVMLMIGGYQYLTAGGNAERARVARKRIADALIGMALALGSFFILNTINPNLLRFEPIEKKIAAVKTELSFLPWCEDQIKAGLVVKFLPGQGSVIDCGDIGEFTPKKKEGEKQATEQISYCVYHDDIGLDTEYEGDPGYIGRRDAELCMQGFWDANKLKTEAEKLKTKKKRDTNIWFAKEKSCLDLSSEPETFKGLRRLGIFSMNDQVCDKWYQHSKLITDSQVDVKRAAWCGYDNQRNTCVSVVIDCKKTNENRPDDGTNVPDSCLARDCRTADACRKKHDKDNKCIKDLDKGYRCKGYEQEPEPWWLPQNASHNREYTTGCVAPLIGSCSDADLERYSFILGPVCAWNPCRFNLDRGGCSFDGTVGAELGLGRGDVSITRALDPADCDNK